MSGVAGAGKSTAARYLVEHHGFVRRPFAALLKGMLRQLLQAQGLPVDAVERMVEGDLKEIPTCHLGGRTPRFAMQTLGTEWGRALAPDLWVNAWMASAAGVERAVVDDVRFENEAAAVRTLGGRVIEVSRPGLFRLAGGHASEVGVIADARVCNNGDISDLHRSIALLAGARADAQGIA